MRNVTIFYLFFETLALLMVVQILFSAPNHSLLSDFERFGYATAAFGLSLGLSVLLKRKYNLKGSRQLITILCLYPCFLYGVHSAVNNSPKFLPESSKPAALRRGIKVLASPHLKKADTATQIQSVTARYPVLDEQIRQLYLNTFRALSVLVQQRNNWSQPFVENNFRLYMAAMPRSRIGYYDSENRVFSSTLSSLMSGAIFPLTSRTSAQLGAMSQYDPYVFDSIFSRIFTAVLEKLGYIPFSITSVRDAKKAVSDREDFYTTNRALLIMDEKLTDLELLPHKLGDSWQDTVRKSLTAHVLKKAGFAVRDNLGEFAFPWREAGRPYLPKGELNRLILWTAPFFLTDNGRMLFSATTFMDPAQTALYESELRAGLPMKIRSTFMHYYHKKASALSVDEALWRSPLAMPLFSSYLKIGAILPWLLLLSLLLLISNFIRVARLNKASALLATVSVTSAVVIFFSPVLTWVMQPVLWLSIKESLIFVN